MIALYSDISPECCAWLGSLHDEFKRLAKLAKERGLYARSTYLGDIRRGLFSHARTMDFIDCAGVKLTVRESPQSGEKGA